jgi:hypothetical protein
MKRADEAATGGAFVRERQMVSALRTRCRALIR